MVYLSRNRFLTIEDVKTLFRVDEDYATDLLRQATGQTNTERVLSYIKRNSQRPIYELAEATGDSPYTVMIHLQHMHRKPNLNYHILSDREIKALKEKHPKDKSLIEMLVKGEQLKVIAKKSGYFPESVRKKNISYGLCETNELAKQRRS